MSVERRIAMTGTPTKNSTCSEALKNIHGLLGFLQHEYGANPTQWRKDITQPFGQVSRGPDCHASPPTTITPTTLTSTTTPRPPPTTPPYPHHLHRVHPQRDPRALERLSGLLGLPNGLMIRHRKADVPGLEDPIRRTVYVIPHPSSSVVIRRHPLLSVLIRYYPSSSVVRHPPFILHHSTATFRYVALRSATFRYVPPEHSNNTRTFPTVPTLHHLS